MEYWEITKDRAQKTLPVWEQYVPTLKIGGKTPVDLQTLIDAFEPLAQGRTAAQDVYDDAVRTKVSNNSGARTSAVRTMTSEEPLGGKGEGQEGAWPRASAPEPARFLSRRWAFA